MKPLRIGTRSSALALWQANHVRQELARLRGIAIEIVPIRTTGDHRQSASIAQASQAIGAEGGKGIFIKEIEDALLSGTVDLAVHSMKDVPTETPRGLAFPAITKREDPRDCLISRRSLTLDKLPQGARVGTSSLRRQAQLRRYRPDLQVLDVRGNVDTRLKKAAAGEFDAIVLAVAGIARLGESHRITEIFSSEVMLPAVGQGALGIETRADDGDTSRLVSSLDDAEARACVTAERALLRELEGGCQVPLGAWARKVSDAEIILEACVLSPDGAQFVRGDERGAAGDAEAVGERLARTLIEAGADKILRLAGRSVGKS
ncbi:MAG: hydroxymethylbilane synthase [Candidatus Acidiferrales bacterium]